MLAIPDFDLDLSEDWEGQSVYKSESVGLVFYLAKDKPGINQYQLSAFTAPDSFDYDGSETDLDISMNLLAMLKHKGINARARVEEDAPD